MSGSPKTKPGILGGNIAQGPDHVLASPYEDLPSPVIASAWGRQLELEDIDAPELEWFIGAYRQGAQTAEPGEVCTGAAGEPA